MNKLTSLRKQNDFSFKYLIISFFALGLFLYVLSYRVLEYQIVLNAIGFSSTVLGFLIALYQLNQEREFKNFFKETINEYIENIDLSCNQIQYLQGLILENNKDFNNFKANLINKSNLNFLHLKNTENTIIELADEFSNYFIDKFLSNINNSLISKNALKNFISVSILTHSQFPYLTDRIKKRGDKDDDFHKLLNTYYKYEIKDDLGKISLHASNIKNEKSMEDVFNKSEAIIKRTSDHERDKLFKYVSNMIKKEVGITTLHNITSDISNISNHYIIYLSRDRICNKTEIKNYLEDNGAINLVSSKFGDVLLFASEQNHKSTDNFVNNELMRRLTQDCPYLIFVVKLTPMNYYKKLNKDIELDSIYVKKSRQIDETYHNKMLNELILASGKPVYDIIENATIDFFADEISNEEMKTLRSNDKIIINSCVDSSNSSWSKTKLLADVSQEILSDSLIKYCDFDFDKATSISGTILENIILWRKLLYGNKP